MQETRTLSRFSCLGLASLRSPIPFCGSFARNKNAVAFFLFCFSRQPVNEVSSFRDWLRFARPSLFVVPLQETRTRRVFLVLLSTRFVSKLPSGHKTKQENFQFSCFLRRGRDSNPRYLSVRRFSRPVQSTTLPPLQKCIFRCRNVVSLFNECKGIAYFGIVQENCEKYFFVFFLSYVFCA